ncbi:MULTISPECIES: MFS transporter [unclassified Actinomyces]|uniref:MFS transporter n=1 Tax=unclassified Actinomyces TaxID=2609248 RepID=UPI002017F6A6|nr:MULTISPECIES: MFS transporter [unclassified Actinomyces]MCL3776581.1 MFS transporter [Actinomyces sp. AC-20-1]MCL3788867.1 MFS transporter [Actinomyces sp. 187325]MCL3791027.1 MFS transporter [Actinomyces sp. 186855]MCL3793447.1 MFS transporter [Actinomyces sp. 217892]
MSTRRLPRRAWLAVVVLGFLGLCAVVRSPVSVIPPLLTQLGTDLGMGQVAQGALTSVPVLCFGLVTPLASRLIARTGVNTAGALMLATIIVGALVRVVGGVPGAFAGTVLIGAAITIGNLVAPMVIGRDFWHRTSLMTGLYSATCNVMVTAVTALAVPAAAVAGWRGSSLVWTVVPVAAALALWLWVYPPGARGPRESLRRRSGMAGWVRERPASTAAAVRVPVLCRPLTWVMALALTGHVLSYNVVTAWLPTALTDLAGMSETRAGVAASVFSLTGILGPLLVPVMFEALRWRGTTVLAVLSACWVTLPVCLVVAPQWWLVPCAVSGVAQGAYFAALFTIVIQRSSNLDENRQTTAAMQSVGYTVAALGPVTAGWLHEVSGGWTVPFAAVVGALAVMTVCGQVAASRRGSARLEGRARLPLDGRDEGTPA